MDALCTFLETDPASPILRTRIGGGDLDALIDMRAIFQQAFESLRFETMPRLLRTAKGQYGLQDYEKVFCVDHKGGQDIYEMRGINRAQRCMIVVRHDQYIAHILPLDATEDLAAFFAAIHLPAS